MTATVLGVVFGYKMEVDPHKILASWDPQGSGISQSFLQVYFEDGGVSEGGDIKEILTREDGCSAEITFKDKGGKSALVKVFDST